jgi:hypothetical protein
MLLTATLTGFWILAFGVLGLMSPRKKTLTKREGQPDAEYQSALRELEAREPQRVKVRKAIALAGMAIGGLSLAGLQIGAVRQDVLALWIDVVRNISQFSLFQWIEVGLFIVPGIYMLAVLVAAKRGTKGNDSSRTNYLDAMKTLIAASGLTVGIISATLKQNDSSPDWIATVRHAAFALAVCMGCSVTTLFSLSILYDMARSKDASTVTVNPVQWWRLALFVIPFAYPALVSFFLGFAFLVHLTYLVK